MARTSAGWLIPGVLALIPLASGCQPKGHQETPVSKAQPGDVLVQIDSIKVVLTEPFQPGTPNGLFDGGVKTEDRPGETKHFEVNAICSMPDLPGWPAYDNIYGRAIKDSSEVGAKGGETQWQLLLPFDGEAQEKGKEKSPEWASRLAQNLCRKGDFQDNSKKNSNPT